MTKRSTILGIPKGIHLRIAGTLAKRANEFESDIFIEHNNLKVNCKSVMSIAVLGAMTGDKIIVSANGKDESKAILSICSIIENDVENKTECEIYEKYIFGASWMDAEGRLYMVKGFHQDWVNKNCAMFSDIKNVMDVIEKLNWINIMIYKDTTIEFHVKSLDDLVLNRIETFLSNTTCNWKSAHIFTTETESLYVNLERDIFEKNDKNIKKLLEQRKLVTQYY